ncbi:MAG: GGDEF domain-containing protein [Planctomycetota bacterium]
MSTMRRDAPARPESHWRVILVGRTGLDQALRRDDGLELIRAQDAMDAIGELSDPIDAMSPSLPAVIVPESAEPRGVELGRFLDALRSVDPDVLLIRVGEAAAGYDGSVAPDADAEAFRSVLLRVQGRGTFTPPDERAAPESGASLRFQEPELPEASPGGSTEQAAGVSQADPVTPHETAISSVATSPSASHAPNDDAALVRALLSGHSILEPAIEIARLRAGRDDLVFDPDTGRLTCRDSEWASGPGSGIMASLSAWLSAWVRLDAQHRELRHAAFTDPLTDAWNRRYFDRFMDAAITQARDARRTVTLMVFDIDNFKSYNDAFGHGAGDEILAETVRLLNSVIRPTDRVCRVGGDEFAVIFYEPEGPRDAASTPPESIYDIAMRFQQQICSHKFPKLGEQAAGTLTISGGLATFPWDGHNAATLLERADQLSIESKRQGKNALTFGQGAEKVCRIAE